MTKEQILLEVLKATIESFCFGITPWIMLGCFIAWIMPAPKGAQSGNIVVNVSQSNGGNE